MMIVNCVLAYKRSQPPNLMFQEIHQVYFNYLNITYLIYFDKLQYPGVILTARQQLFLLR